MFNFKYEADNFYQSFRRDEVVSETGWAEWLKTVSLEYRPIMFDMIAYRCIQSVPTETTAPKICVMYVRFPSSR